MAPPPNNKSSSEGGIVARIFVALVAAMVVYIIVTNLCRGHRNACARAGAAARPQPPPEPHAPVDEPQLHRASAASPTAHLPTFTYSRSVKQNVTSGGEDAATCSVCLGAFQFGETVRLLPLCLHLYHVECIDPWLDVHSTCPLCRSNTDPSTDVGDRLPPVQVFSRSGGRLPRCIERNVGHSACCCRDP